MFFGLTTNGYCYAIIVLCCWHVSHFIWCYADKVASSIYQSEITTCYGVNQDDHDIDSFSSTRVDEAEGAESTKCIPETEIQETRLVQRDNVAFQTAIEIIQTWILTYGTPLLSTLADFR